MITIEFDNVVNQRCEKIVKILTSKAKEYASDTDRLHNFKVAARTLNCTPERALLGMMMKHQVSVMDLIDNIDKGLIPSEPMIEEKLGDFCNYIILLEALFKERLQNIQKV